MKRRTFLFLLSALGLLPGKAAAKRKPPEPLDISWIRKSVESARSGIEILADGRMKCWIEHQVVRGVTPSMLVWWFKHLEGEMQYDGKKLSRYRVWHPRDHIAIEYASRNPDGTVGVGSSMRRAAAPGSSTTSRKWATSSPSSRSSMPRRPVLQ